jgi:hypothetical protein
VVAAEVWTHWQIGRPWQSGGTGGVLYWGACQAGRGRLYRVVRGMTVHLLSQLQPPCLRERRGWA